MYQYLKWENQKLIKLYKEKYNLKQPEKNTRFEEKPTQILKRALSVWEAVWRKNKLSLVQMLK